jgi:hypothetical protein
MVLAWTLFLFALVDLLIEWIIDTNMDITPFYSVFFVLGGSKYG